MKSTSLAVFLAASMLATVGCASKNYVKKETGPLINKTNELDDLTAKNTRDIKDVEFDLMVSDLGQIEKRLERLEKDLKKMRSPELEKEN